MGKDREDDTGKRTPTDIVGLRWPWQAEDSDVSASSSVWLRHPGTSPAPEVSPGDLRYEVPGPRFPHQALVDGRPRKARRCKEVAGTVKGIAGVSCTVTAGRKAVP